MKKLYKHIALFSIPFILVFAVIFFLPYNKKFAFNIITGGCSIEYTYKRIVEDSNRLDIAFMGSSKTHCGVNDLLINFIYQYNYKIDLSTANISFCGTGRNLQYTIIKELFKYKKPKVLVIEIREDEDPNGHISFGVIADSKDILTAPILSNKHYIKDIFNGLKSRYDFHIWGHSTDLTYKGPKYGFGPNYREADSIYLNYFYHEKLKKLNRNNIDWQNDRLPIYYLDKICKLAKDNDCEVYFLYLTSFGFIEDNIKYLDYYEKNGKVLYPPNYLMSDPNYWSDQNHLKRNAADSLSSWLAEEMFLNLYESLN